MKYFLLDENQPIMIQSIIFNLIGFLCSISGDEKWKVDVDCYCDVVVK
jgi:hypothetical protein